MVKLRWGATTDPGRVRTENEDTFVTEPMVFAVADGMGGHQAGEVASALAASIMRDRLGGGAPSEDAAAAAVGEANAAIYGAAKANPAQSGMGTTLTAIAVLTEESPDGQERLVLLNVGDSRTYRFRGGRLQRVTVDHSYVQELVAAGHISIEEARTHPRRNIVTRALGIEPVVRADMWTLPIVRGDRYVLASDGLVDEVPDHEILDLVESIEDPQELSKQLVEIANRHGGRDNVTVVVVDVVEGADPPDATDELQFDPDWAEGIQEPALWADDDTTGEAPPEVSAEGVEADPPDDPEPITVRDATARPTLPPPGNTGTAAGATAAAGFDAAAIAASVDLPATPPPPDATQLSPAGAGTVDAGPATENIETVAMGPGSSDVGAVTETDATTINPVLPGLGTSTASPPPGGIRIADSAKAAEPATPRRKRRFTGGAFLFTIVIAAILAITFVLIAVDARSGYFVGFDGDTVVVYKGQRDSVLWFEPTVNVRSDTTRDELTPALVDAIEARPTFDSADEAATFIQDEVIPTSVPETTTTTAAPTTTTAATLPGETSTTFIEGG